MHTHTHTHKEKKRDNGGGEEETGEMKECFCLTQPNFQNFFMVTGNFWYFTS